VNARPKVGDHVVAAHDLRDWGSGGTVPAGTQGVVVAVGPDAAVGYANVTFASPGATVGLPVLVWPGRDQAAVQVTLAADGRPLCQEQVWAHHYPRPCTSRARYLATDPANPSGGTVPLCRMHANTGRWAGYADPVWVAL
jgi:hypothetical protein